MSIAKQEFTNAGKSMLGRAQNAERLTISKIVVGSGSAAAPSDLWPLTALKTYVMDVTISRKQDYGDGTLLVEGSLRSDLAPSAFDLREVGIMAHVAAEADRLYSVANCFATAPDHIDPAAPTIQVFKIKLIVDRIPTANLTVSIGPSENVVGENRGTAAQGPGWYDDAAGNILYFKRAVAGSHVELIEDPDTITIGVKTLKANLDLYVPATYPGIPDPTKLFPTIQAALDSVADVAIPPDKFVTVHVYSGRFNFTANVTHPNASQIKIVALDVVARAVTGTLTCAGTLPNIDVTMTLTGGNTGMAVNDVVYLHDAPNGQLECCGFISALVSTTGIKVRMIMQAVAPPASVAALGTTKLLWFPTQISSGADINVFSCPNGIGQLKNFGLRSTASHLGTAFNMQGNANLENLCAVNYNIGFASGNDVAYLTPICAANGCVVGITAGPSGAFNVQAPTLWKRVSWSGCSTYGIWLVAGAYTGGNGTSTYVCNNVTGIRSDTQGAFINGFSPGTTGGIVVAWNDHGLSASVLGVILTALTSTNTVAANVSFDAIANAGSQISIIHNATLAGLKLSPANNVLGPDGGYINIDSP